MATRSNKPALAAPAAKQVKIRTPKYGGRIVTQAEAAKMCGKDPRAIRKQRDQGRPWFDKSGHVLVDHPEFIAYRDTYTPQQRDKSLKDDAGKSLKDRRALADTIAAEYKAKSQAMEYARRRGELVRRSDLAAFVFGHLATLHRNLLESIDGDADAYIALAKSENRPAIVSAIRDRMTKLLAETKRASEKELRKNVVVDDDLEFDVGDGALGGDDD